MTPEAILFDCDGVLVDSEPAAFALLAEDLARAGLVLSHAEMEAQFLGGTIRGLHMKARALGADLADDWPDDFYDRLYARLAEGTPLFDGVEALLDRLDKAGIAYAVGSNGAPRKMEITLGQHPSVYARLRGVLFSGQEIGAPKPAPDLYLTAARALGVDPARCVVVEDSPTGVRAGRAAGMRCFGFAPNGNFARLEAEGAEPLRAMADLPARIGI
ncbi:HAD family phosphatase [Aliigemmobacter aestuarii]|uniref:HAD family phosphatase n=1 Tax=Aliigemmobacter aestuarii TaxID=1445661 RepID=A0A4S3MS22_9RHOB|nr:HAD family phosphatase [Gemmobacter aestuarii]THD85338.1 HAD family phosphatase [Gemmobacter aestuarii]